MSITNHNFPLRNGAEIPAIALGTAHCPDEDAYNGVKAALEAGYRHIDTAHGYKNEGPVGKAIRDSGIPREEIFVTTKLWVEDFHHPVKALDASLDALGLEYVDLYLMHWPIAVKENGADDKTKELDDSIDFIQAYANMQEISEDKARAIGVSNFDVENLMALLTAPTTKTPPAANQVELHVKLPQQLLVDFCHSKNIVPEAWGPLGQGDLEYDVIKKIAKKHNVSPANVVLNWNIKRRVVVLPKSTNAERIKDNLAYCELDEQDMSDIMGISKDSGIQRIGTPKKAFGIDMDIFHYDADSM